MFSLENINFAHAKKIFTDKFVVLADVITAVAHPIIVD